MAGRPPSAQAADLGSAVPLESLRDDARSLSPADFEARHGAAFLLLSAVRPQAPQNTFSTHLELLGDDETSERTGALSTLVYPLRSDVHIVTVGRAPDNDVVIPDRSISRRHAFLKRGPDGGYLVLDAGSSNGTTVNGASVLVKGAGPPTAVRPGDTLRVGALEFTFAHAAGLQEFAAKQR
jgi:pSer/pThr/pTyr-binding forkhead associated (FHA) protein